MKQNTANEEGVGCKVVNQKLTLSVTEAAKRLGVSRTTMYHLVKIKGFPTVQIGNRVLVSVKGLEKWVEEQAQKGWSPDDNFYEGKKSTV